jgi:hypothetical protein
MQPGEDKIVAERIYGVLTAKRDPKPTTMKPPAATLNGRWNVVVEYYSSKSTYTWTLEQDGNWLQGVHTGMFSTQNLVGSIEGNVMRVRNSDNPPGDHLAFTFTGNVDNDSISGTIYLVEYGTAKFVATRYKYEENRVPLTVPGGPPLAT